jgi:hypothetical protein
MRECPNKTIQKEVGGAAQFRGTSAAPPWEAIR